MLNIFHFHYCCNNYNHLLGWISYSLYECWTESGFSKTWNLLRGITVQMQLHLGLVIHCLYCTEVSISNSYLYQKDKSE